MTPVVLLMLAWCIVNIPLGLLVAWVLWRRATTDMEAEGE